MSTGVGITQASSSAKRSADHFEDEGESSSKAPKLFPIFTRPDPNAQDGTFKWVKPSLGPNRSCLHGVNGTPEERPKIAGFDLDGCLIEGSFTNKKVKGAAPSFKWWNQSVPTKLRKVHQEGYTIVIFTNQALKGANAISEWKKKIPLIGAALANVPFHIFAATAKDGYRKPIPGMWYELEHMFAEKNIKIVKEHSFFVGDAAGRKGDHAGTDRKWALNLDLPFFTPEEYFLNLSPVPFTLTGFHVSSLSTSVKPSSPPSLPATGKPEIVLFVGLPALGKSSYYRKHFQSAGYVHINQDMLGTRAKCVKAVEGAISNKQSCVIDNTNRDAATRQHYVGLARKRNVSIRCIVFDGTLELAWHNNLYRAYNLSPERLLNEPKRELLPYLAFTSFASKYEEPQLSEGFSEITKIDWVFEGSEEDRKRWSMWLQIEGK